MAYGINILFFLLVWFIHPIFLAHADINVPNKLQNDPKTCEENSDIQRNQPLLERGRFEIQKAIENSEHQFGYLECRVLKECIKGEESYSSLYNLPPTDIKPASIKETAMALGRYWEFILTVHDPSQCFKIETLSNASAERIIQRETEQFNETKNRVESLEKTPIQNQAPTNNNKQAEVYSPLQTLEALKKQVNRKSQIKKSLEINDDDQWTLNQITSRLYEMGYGAYLGNLSIQSMSYRVDPAPNTYPVNDRYRIEFNNNNFLLQFGCGICSPNTIIVGPPENYSPQEYGLNLDSAKKKVLVKMRKYSVNMSVNFIAQALKTRRLEDRLKIAEQIKDLNLKMYSQTQTMSQDKIERYRMLLQR